MARKRSRYSDDADQAAPKKSPVLLIVAIVGLLGCLCCVPSAGVGVFFAFRGGPDGGGGFGGGDKAPQAKFQKDDLHRVEPGMTVEEVNAVLGQGRVATQGDLSRAFGSFNLGADAKWMNAGRDAGVTTWREWQNGDQHIFVGFGKGKKSGKDRALASFWVRPLDRGFESEPGILPLPGFDGPIDPDEIAAERDEKNKVLNDPKFKAGDPKKLIVGRWLVARDSGYGFNADGTYERIGRRYKGTYRFVAADEIELNISPGGEFDGKPGMTERYKIWVSADEIIMQLLPHRLKLTYKRAN